MDYRPAAGRDALGRRATQAESLAPYRLRSRGLPNYPVAARRADGSLITLSDLPDPHCRWTRLRKQVVMDCIDHGLLGLDAARRRYRLTEAELGEWRAAAASRGRAPVVWPQRPAGITDGVVRRGDLEVDLAAGTVQVEGRELMLSESEWTVLATIVRAGGEIVTSAMIMAVLYGEASQAAGIKIVDVLVCRLRRKLGPAAGLLEVVWGRGYFLGE